MWQAAFYFPRGEGVRVSANRCNPDCPMRRNGEQELREKRRE
jgi:hypothetical protein